MNRRVFVAILAGGAALARGPATAQTAGKVDEADPQAVGLGYKADASTVDKAKYPQHAANQVCGRCTFFQGKPTDASAPCQIFGGKQVSSKGWCTAWNQRAA